MDNLARGASRYDPKVQFVREKDDWRRSPAADCPVFRGGAKGSLQEIYGVVKENVT